ncbi:MAG: hypothetical protein GXY83_22090 [Rhodopirellula sp.]|nr:hypothetical protein [Rhodopirellula sp.]
MRDDVLSCATVESCGGFAALVSSAVPSQIESTTAPGYLLKLRSKRLALVSNGKTGRQELLLRFSEDSAK